MHCANTEGAIVAIVRELGAVAQTAIQALSQHGQERRQESGPGGQQESGQGRWWQASHGAEPWRLGVQRLSRPHVSLERELFPVLRPHGCGGDPGWVTVPAELAGRQSLGEEAARGGERHGMGLSGERLWMVRGGREGRGGRSWSTPPAKREASVSQEADEWACGTCQILLFAWREDCYQCGRAKAEVAVHEGSIFPALTAEIARKYIAENFEKPDLDLR